MAPTLVFSIPCRDLGETWTGQGPIEPFWIGVEVQGKLPGQVIVSIVNRWYAPQGRHRLVTRLIPPWPEAEPALRRSTETDHDFFVLHDFVHHSRLGLVVLEEGIWQCSIECDGGEVQRYPLSVIGQKQDS